jgi:hypothetical protein
MPKRNALNCFFTYVKEHANSEKNIADAMMVYKSSDLETRPDEKKPPLVENKVDEEAADIMERLFTI